MFGSFESVRSFGPVGSFGSLSSLGLVHLGQLGHLGQLRHLNQLGHQLSINQVNFNRRFPATITKIQMLTLAPVS